MKQSMSKIALAAVLALMLVCGLHLFSKDEPNITAAVILGTAAAITAGMIGLIGAIERLGETLATRGVAKPATPTKRSKKTTS